MRNFCAICGVHVRSISADPEPGLPIEDLEWHQELRAGSCNSFFLDLTNPMLTVALIA